MSTVARHTLEMVQLADQANFENRLGRRASCD